MGHNRVVESAIVALPEAEIWSWAEQALGSPVVSMGRPLGNLSRVVGARLTDGRGVVVKVRAWEPRLTACAAVQTRLMRAGFPCPALIAGPQELAGWAVSAEEARFGGEQLAPDGTAALYAGLLAELISLAPSVDDVPGLEPSPPWVGWDHRGSRLWPGLDDLGRDLNELRGPKWVDDAADAARSLLLDLPLPSIVGHGDFESQNMRWKSWMPYVVHDWDSVVAQPEPAIVGAAAAVWPAAGAPDQAASFAQTGEFIAAYCSVGGKVWTSMERNAAWAAGVWVRAFNAKKDAASGGGPQLHLLATDIEDRRSQMNQRS